MDLTGVPSHTKVAQAGRSLETQHPVRSPRLSQAPALEALKSKHTVKKGSKVPDTQATAFCWFVLHVDLPSQVYGDDDVPANHPHVLEFNQVFCLPSIPPLFNSSNTTSDSSCWPGLGVGFGDHPTTVACFIRPVSLTGALAMPTRVSHGTLNQRAWTSPMQPVATIASANHLIALSIAAVRVGEFDATR